jgi:predicted membrane chloride channel (bestrophin family)
MTWTKWAGLGGAAVVILAAYLVFVDGVSKFNASLFVLGGIGVAIYLIVRNNPTLKV